MSDKQSPQDKVRQFLEKIGHKLPDGPNLLIVDESLARVWAKIFIEEAFELVEAMGVRMTVLGYPVGTGAVEDGSMEFHSQGPIDLIEIADGAADTHYVALGICSLCGITLDPITDAVCDNNLAKFGPGHTFKDGKLIKPPDHPKPPILDLIREQQLKAACSR